MSENLYPLKKTEPQSNTSATNPLPITLGDSAAIDAFDRLRVSNPTTLFDSKQLYDTGSLIWDTELNGGGSVAHFPESASVKMNVTSDGDYAIRQTKMRFNYQPGKSQLILTTFTLNPQVDTIKRVGYFNTTGSGDFTAQRDGIYLESSGSNVYLCIEHGSVNKIEKIPQSEWNIDTFGVGEKNPSGYILDFTKSQISFTDVEWLGVGRVRVGFVINGIAYYAHHFNHANIQSGVYMRTPNHSIRYEIYSEGGAGELEHICSSVMSEGGLEKTGIVKSYNIGVSDDVDITSEDITALLGIRLKKGYLDLSVDIEKISTMCDSGANYVWSLYLNPTLSTTPSWNIDRGGVELFRTPTGGASNITITPGTGEILSSGYVSNNQDGSAEPLRTSIRIGSKINEDRDILVLTVAKNEIGGEDFYGSITWRELT